MATDAILEGLCDRARNLLRALDRQDRLEAAASERVHDLVQAGLASRELIGDQIRSTALGEGLVALIEDLAGKAGKRLSRELDQGPADAPASTL